MLWKNLVSWITCGCQPEMQKPILVLLVCLRGIKYVFKRKLRKIEIMKTRMTTATHNYVMFHADEFISQLKPEADYFCYGVICLSSSQLS